jgi:UDP-N-acetylmuramoylalanine--D-glutamate ligase
VKRPTGPGDPVLVIGLGVTGRAVVEAVRRLGGAVAVYQDAPVAATEAAAAGLGLQVVSDPARLPGLVEHASIVVPSPGVPVSHPVYALATGAGVAVHSEIELAHRLLARRAAPRPCLAAITGTNGKTTVTALVAAMLQASGRAAVTGGNIGRPLVDAVTTPADVVVAEVSSFQLEYTERFRPAVSCWLNLAPDHLDWHPDLDHYARAKARIWANQGPGDVAVFNRDDPAVAAAAADVPTGVRLVDFGSGDAAWAVEDDCLRGPSGQSVVGVGELPRRLPHDLANSLAAAAVASACGATPAGIRSALVDTPAPPHRVQWLGGAGGVDWYDDSKATTPAAVLAAVAGFASVVLIAGGRNKGIDLAELAAGSPPVRAVVAIGESAPEVVAAFDGVVEVRRADSMEEAVTSAADLAAPGDAVILSPGCASFDWYPSYVARGDHFTALVKIRLQKGRM